MLTRFHTSPTIESKLTSRRNFTRNAVLGSCVLGVGLVTGGFVRLLWPNKTGAFGSVLTVPAKDIPPIGGTPLTFAPGKFYIVHNDDGLLALYWKCVHLGCTVPWAPNFDEFRCPCHGSIYNYDGVNTGGPAPRPLDLMKITVEASGDLSVDTGAIMERHSYEPSQAVPYPAA
jgi:cytochrome b6-f complex iron-sulfur subunit